MKDTTSQKKKVKREINKKKKKRCSFKALKMNDLFVGQKKSTLLYYIVHLSYKVLEQDDT